MIGTCCCYSLKNVWPVHNIYIIERRDIAGNQNSNTPKIFFFVKFKQAILLITCWWCVKYAFSEIILQGNITALGLLESYTYIGLQEICALPCLKYKQQNIYFTKLNIHFQILTPLGFLFLPTLSCNISKYMISTNLVVYNIIKTTLS